jgi:hypothetical protein
LSNASCELSELDGEAVQSDVRSSWTIAIAVARSSSLTLAGALDEGLVLGETVGAVTDADGFELLHPTSATRSAKASRGLPDLISAEFTRDDGPRNEASCLYFAAMLAAHWVIAWIVVTSFAVVLATARLRKSRPDLYERVALGNVRR